MVPDTTAYLLLGLAAVAVIMGGLVGGMTLRYNSLKKDEQTLDVVEREES